MKFLAFALFTMQLFAASFDPKLLNLIGPTARGATGMDVERHRQSAFNDLFPATSGARQSIEIITAAQGGLLIAIGDATDADDGGGITLDNTTLIRGDETLTQEAIQAWPRTDLIPTSLAMRAQQLSGLYDNWFVIVKPLDLAAHVENPSPFKYREEILQAIEEVSGGIRFGTNIAVKVEALMHSEEDAKALASLGRWLPGLVQFIQSRGPIPQLVDIAEHISIKSEGRTVTLTFDLPEAKVKEVAAAQIKPMD